MRKKICIITGSRSEYSSFYPILKKIKEDGAFILQIIATGAHLSGVYGMTYRELEKDGFRIDKKINILLFGDNERGITKSVGYAIMKFAEALAELKPDLVILIGDRFETFAAAVASFIAKIPIAHIGGGDLTRGAMDDTFRHAITKMSYLHFTITPDSRKRVIQLGEDPKRVFTVGAPAIDNIRKLKLIPKKQLEKELNFSFGKKNILVTFHPVTLEENTSERQFKVLLKALDRFKGLKIIFTKPNADLYGKVIIKLIERYVNRDPARAFSFASMGQRRYLSLMKYVDAVMGNSSSGIVEAPIFGKPTINIGDRQEGRLKAASVIDCRPAREEIIKALKKAFSPRFKKSHMHKVSPYGSGNAAEKILRVIKKEVNKIKSLKKGFYELQPVILRNKYYRA